MSETAHKVDTLVEESLRGFSENIHLSVNNFCTKIENNAVKINDRINQDIDGVNNQSVAESSSNDTNSECNVDQADTFGVENCTYSGIVNFDEELISDNAGSDNEQENVDDNEAKITAYFKPIDAKTKASWSYIPSSCNSTTPLSLSGDASDQIQKSSKSKSLPKISTGVCPGESPLPLISERSKKSKLTKKSKGQNFATSGQESPNVISEPSETKSNRNSLRHARSVPRKTRSSKQGENKEKLSSESQPKSTTPGKVKKRSKSASRNSCNSFENATDRPPKTKTKRARSVRLKHSSVHPFENSDTSFTLEHSASEESTEKKEFMDLKFSSSLRMSRYRTPSTFILAEFAERAASGSLSNFHAHTENVLPVIGNRRLSCREHSYRESCTGSESDTPVHSPHRPRISRHLRSDQSPLIISEFSRSPSTSGKPDSSSKSESSTSFEALATVSLPVEQKRMRRSLSSESSDASSLEHTELLTQGAVSKETPGSLHKSQESSKSARSSTRSTTEEPSLNVTPTKLANKFHSFKARERSASINHSSLYKPPFDAHFGENDTPRDNDHYLNAESPTALKKKSKSLVKKPIWIKEKSKKKDQAQKSGTSPLLAPKLQTINNRFDIFLSDNQLASYFFTPQQKLSKLIEKLINNRPGLSLETHIATDWQGHVVDLDQFVEDIPNQQIFFLKKEGNEKPLDIIICENGKIVQRQRVLKPRTLQEIDALCEGVIEGLKGSDMKIPTFLNEKKKDKKNTKEENAEKKSTVLEMICREYESAQLRTEIDGLGITSVIAGTIPVLVEILTNNLGKDEDYDMTFVMTSDGFVEAFELLELLQKRWTDVAQGPNTIPIRERILEVLTLWILKRPDIIISDQKLKEEFILWTEKIDYGDLNKNIVTEFKSRLLQMYNDPVNNHSDIGGGVAPDPLLHHLSVTGNYDFLDFHPIELARQMTLLDAELFRKIKPHEWVGLGVGWKDRSKNIDTYTVRSNQISGWVSSLVVLAETKEMRAHIITRFIYIVMECLALNNFNTVIAIFLGLNVVSCTRLKQTWSSLDKLTLASWEKIREFTSPLNKFKILRMAQEVVETPCIPYLGVYIGDLTLMKEVIPNKTEDGLVNFSKFQFVARIVQRYEDFRSRFYYKLVPVKPLQQFLSTWILVLSEATLEEESKKRESTEDNNQFKQKLGRKATNIN